MSDKALSSLTDAGSLLGSDSIYIVRGGNSRKAVLPPGVADIGGLTRSRGDLIVGGASAWTNLPIGTSGYHIQSDGTDPSWAGFVPAGTGAQTRTWQAKARDIVSVFDFMTTAQIADVQARTLSNSVSTAVQAAIDYVETNGGTLHFPSGSYRLDTTLTVEANNVFLDGEGHATVFVNGQTNVAAINIGDNTTRFNRGGIRNIAFAQRSGVTPVGGNIGMLVRKVANWHFENIEVHQFPASLRNGLEFVDVSQSFISDVGVQDCTNSGIILQDNCLDLYVDSVRADANGNNGIEILGCQGLYFVNCTAFNNESHGWAITPQGAEENRNMFFVSCVGDTSGSDNWRITELYNSAFVSCWGSTQASTLANTGASGFLLEGPNVKSIRFTNSVALFNNGSGFRLLSSGGLPTDLEFDGCQSGSTALASNGNGQGGTGYGYDLGSASNIRVIGGIVQGNATGTFTGHTAGSNVLIAGVLGHNTGWSPGSNDGAALGSASFAWSDLFLASGGVINFGNGEVLITSAANDLTFTGASNGYQFDAALKPTANDGAALGVAAAQWSDLFLAEGAVINFDNGDFTITQAGDVLAFAGTSGLTLDLATSTIAYLISNQSIEINFDANDTASDRFVVSKGSGKTELFRLTTNGLPIWAAQSTTPETLGTNGSFTLTATSNTNFRISYRGSDGTTRVGNITLA